MVSSRIAPATANSELYVTVSHHTAPRKFSCCQQYLAGRLICGGLGIVAMCMEKLEVVTVSLPALLGRNDMIGLQNIAMFEIQSTPGTNTALLLQELGFPGIEHGVFTHAGGPVQEVAIKWAAGRLDFRVPDNMVIGVPR